MPKGKDVGREITEVSRQPVEVFTIINNSENGKQ